MVRDGDELVAAARLSVHERLADVPEAEEYAAVGLQLEGRIAAPARVVVAAAARRHGLAGQLLDAQDAAARAAGCAFAVRQSSPAMSRLLARRGWRDAGPAGLDERFPGRALRGHGAGARAMTAAPGRGRRSCSPSARPTA